ncbi:M15 family metallopeptidase [Alteribacter natronophilus]|uniref:M15 family metallopeptidase n=1 Tax=Alteribacter natronophilus TaxID=2583810 RepID=UPI00110F47A4|nr:M15 family metallopeptidase [Alteribacter natronophilus]TMW70745.1 D-alanyl-D-alanine dipeptidase [Alteribacter natronophilus]
MNDPLEINYTNKGWQQIAIRENSEPLVAIESLQEPRLRSRPMYREFGVTGALDQCWVRKGVAEKLIKALTYLPDHLSIIVWDGYRPFGVQKALFDDFRKKLEAEHPEESAEQIVERTKTFVSLPSTDPDEPSTHMTGGAVDLTLSGPKGELDMGTAFDDFSDRAGTLYLEKYPDQADDRDRTARDNRRLLVTAMHRAGFTNYIHEWWHFDWGNQWWAAAKGHDEARYGLAREPGRRG